MNLPAEALELEAPIRVNRMALRKDSGGAGKYRGGLGCIRELELLEGVATVTHRGERHNHPPRGSRGGRDGMLAHSIIVRADGSEEVIPSRKLLQMRAGDRMVVNTAGGAGYGKPGERDPEAIRRDVKNGKVSAPSAENTLS